VAKYGVAARKLARHDSQARPVPLILLIFHPLWPPTHKKKIRYYAIKKFFYRMEDDLRATVGLG
jgi:hypothetical protein